MKPGNCGPNSLFLGQVGDWTWETVGMTSGIDVLTARNGRGGAAYLSFFYMRLTAPGQLYHLDLGFGDRIDVLSRCFGFGSESVFTVHRVSPAGVLPPPVDPLDPDEYYLHPRSDCLYVASFNRWISRSQPGSNENLVVASPPGFAHEHLPVLPAERSPRLVYNQARRWRTFRAEQRCTPLGPELTVDYVVDVTRDLNGAGLLYFASYWSIIDKGVHALWVDAGYSDQEFLNRRVADQQVCLLGNAGAGTELELRCRRWRDSEHPQDEVYDIVVQTRNDGRLLAISTVRIRTGGFSSDR